MRHPVLDQHKIIGIDIDETLIDGKRSNMLQDWVRANHQDYELHLITFRYGKDFDLIQEDLLRCNVDHNWFKGVHGIPSEIMLPYMQNLQRLTGSRNNPKKYQRTLKFFGLDANEVENTRRAVEHWKAKKCSELGATLLIDDLETIVAPGCELYGVTFLNSNHL